MKVLWVNPSFLDYRVPVYSNINQILGGEFYLLYSKNRVPQRVIEKIEKELGKNALGLSGEKSFLIGKKSEFANKYISLPYQKGLYETIKTVKPDLIIGEGFFQWTPWAVWYSRKHKIPIYISYERTEHTERNCPKWRAMYRKFIAKYARGFLINGSLTLSYLKKNNISDNKNIILGCMCADSEELSLKVKSITEQEKQELTQSIIGENHTETGFIYLFIGRFIELKGIKQLLDAWEKHIESHNNDYLVLVGEGPCLDAYKNDFSGVKGIRFVGGVDYNAIYRYYSIADVFILPTLEDNWSLVIPEAMACGLPVATSKYNGCYPELVTDKNGFVFDSLNESSIIEALEYFHRDSINLKEMGKMSIQIENEYSPKKVAERIIKGLEGV